jgi:DNA-binding HxlR family transcriptional regulator
MANRNPTNRSLMLKVRRLRYDARELLSEYPAIYFPYVRLTHSGGRGKVLSKDTEVVIDGFTRSASTFAVMAFQLSQDRPVRVARHLHAVAQFAEAAKRGLPTILAIRDPESTVLSAVVQEPHLTIEQALTNYGRFYLRIAPFCSRFVIADFAQVTKDFGMTIRRLNQKFGTHFREFEHTETNVRQCFDLIGERWRRTAALEDFQSGFIGLDELQRALDQVRREMPQRRVREMAVARPSEVREAKKAELRVEFWSRGTAPLRARAFLAYERVAAWAKVDSW